MAGGAQTEPDPLQSSSAKSTVNRIGTTGLVIAVAVLALALAAYLIEVAMPRHFHELTWFDLDVYRRAGLIARHRPNFLYSWHETHRTYIKFTYTPFAATVFAAGSKLSIQVLHWLMTVVSLVTLPLIAWITLRALNWRGRDRLVVTIAVTALALWAEPVRRALQLGQIELLLMLLIVWDLCQSDRRWWKGAGIGVAAGIKMVPLIFIPYLILCGKIKQAVVASVTFAATVLIGFATLPHASSKWWLSGYFLHAGNVGDVGSMLDQSILAMVTRAVKGHQTLATEIWLPIALLTAVIGLAAAAALHRRGQPVAGWVTCALTGLLVSPISWDQHWVWIVPIVIVLIDRAVRSQGRARRMWWAMAVIAFGLYAYWPAHLYGPKAFVPYFGLISFFQGPHPGIDAYHLHGIELLSWNLFVVAGAVMLAVAVIAAAREWRSRGTVPAVEASGPVTT